MSAVKVLSNKENRKLVIDFDFIKVYDDGREYIPYIKTLSGQEIEHEHFPRNLKGRVCAIDLALTIESGKVLLRGSNPKMKEDDLKLQLNHANHWGENPP